MLKLFPCGGFFFFFFFSWWYVCIKSHCLLFGLALSCDLEKGSIRYFTMW